MNKKQLNKLQKLIRIAFLDKGSDKEKASKGKVLDFIEDLKIEPIQKSRVKAIFETDYNKFK